MSVVYCALCERPVEASRLIRGRTYLWAFLSAGLSLLAIPFYRKRCPICMGKSLVPIPAEELARLYRAGRPELENRLVFVEEQMGRISEELDRVEAERDFYRDLTAGRGQTTDSGNEPE